MLYMYYYVRNVAFIDGFDHKSKLGFSCQKNEYEWIEKI